MICQILSKVRKRVLRAATILKKMSFWVLTNLCDAGIINIVVGIADTSHGGVAQLVERLNGIQEVRGSTPLISTKELILI